MPDFGSATFSQTDASNATGTMPSWSGAAAPSTLDDAGRALQGAVTREWNWRNYTVTSAGTGTALTLTYSVAPAAYYNGQRFAFITNTAVTGSCTLNVNSLGATTIKKVLGGTLTNLASGDIPAGRFVEVAYNTANTCFVLVDSILPLISDSSGNVGIGRTAAAGYKFQTSGTIGANDGTVEVFMAPVAASSASIIGNVSNHAVVVYQNNAEAFRVDTNKNVLVTNSGGLGYGTGSGGTVTQITSKGTGVNLNKTNGRIITTADALAAATAVQFSVTNSTVAATDTVIIHISSGDANVGLNYQVWVGSVSAGSFVVTLLNRSGGSRSEALTLNFAVIKAVTA
jgi:hypothetical protein